MALEPTPTGARCPTGVGRIFCECLSFVLCPLPMVARAAILTSVMVPAGKSVFTAHVSSSFCHPCSAVLSHAHIKLSTWKSYFERVITAIQCHVPPPKHVTLGRHARVRDVPVVITVLSTLSSKPPVESQHSF